MNSSRSNFMKRKFELNEKLFFFFFTFFFCRVFSLFRNFLLSFLRAPSTTSTLAFLPPCINISTQPYHVSTSCYTPSTRRYTRCEHSIMLSDMPGISFVCEERKISDFLYQSFPFYSLKFLRFSGCRRRRRQRRRKEEPSSMIDFMMDSLFLHWRARECEGFYIEFCFFLLMKNTHTYYSIFQRSFSLLRIIFTVKYVNNHYDYSNTIIIFPTDGMNLRLEILYKNNISFLL